MILTVGILGLIIIAMLCSITLKDDKNFKKLNERIDSCSKVQEIYRSQIEPMRQRSLEFEQAIKDLVGQTEAFSGEFDRLEQHELGGLASQLDRLSASFEKVKSNVEYLELKDRNVKPINRVLLSFDPGSRPIPFRLTKKKTKLSDSEARQKVIKQVKKKMDEF